MRIAAIFTITFALLCSCQPKQQAKQSAAKAYSPKAPLDDHELVNRLQDSITQYGNYRAYSELASYYVLENWNEELLYYSLIMANKYNNVEGHYQIYISLSKPHTGETLEQLDERTKAFALYHLLKSYEMGFESAKYQVDEIFGEKSIPKSSYYLQEFVKAEQNQK